MGASHKRHPQTTSNLMEFMGQTATIGSHAFSEFNESIEIYLPRLLLSFLTIQHAKRKQRLSALLGKPIRALITMSFSTKERVWYRIDKNKDQKKNSVKKRARHNDIK